MLKYRQLDRGDLDGLHDIDRGDFSPTTYRVKHGELILEDREFWHTGFTRAEWDSYIRKFSAELHNGVTILFGAFDGSTLVGISGLEVDKYRGSNRDMLNMGPMWVSSAYRRPGTGTQLLEMTRRKARDLGTRALYVSATPVPGTVEFYLRAGCQLLSVPDKYLFALEREDIHMGLELKANKTDSGGSGGKFGVPIVAVSMLTLLITRGRITFQRSYKPCAFVKVEKMLWRPKAKVSNVVHFRKKNGIGYG